MRVELPPMQLRCLANQVALVGIERIEDNLPRTLELWYSTSLKGSVPALCKLNAESLGGLVPSNDNYVCFDCRVNVRRGKTAAGAPVCPRCGKACDCLGYKVPIPAKRDERAWSQLYESVQKRALSSLLLRREERVREVHRLERHINDLERRPLDSGRTRAIRELKRRLTETKRSVG